MLPESAWQLIPEFEPDIQNPRVTALARNVGLSKREHLAYLWANYLIEQLQNQSLTVGIEIQGNNLISIPSNLPTPRITDVSAGFIIIPPESEPRSSAITNSKIQLVDAKDYQLAFGVVLGFSELRSGRQPLNQFSGGVLAEKFPIVVEQRTVVTNAPPDSIRRSIGMLCQTAKQQAILWTKVE